MTASTTPLRELVSLMKCKQEALSIFFPFSASAPQLSVIFYQNKASLNEINRRTLVAGIGKINQIAYVQWQQVTIVKRRFNLLVFYK